MWLRPNCLSLVFGSLRVYVAKQPPQKLTSPSLGRLWPFPLVLVLALPHYSNAITIASVLWTQQANGSLAGDAFATKARHPHHGILETHTRLGPLLTLVYGNMQHSPTPVTCFCPLVPLVHSMISLPLPTY